MNINTYGVAPAPIPAAFPNLPQGTWGISYDLSVRPITAMPPNGYGYRSTASVYQSIARCLTQCFFTRQQKSVWHLPGTTAGWTWRTMMRLRYRTLPPGIFPVAVQGLEMFYIARPNNMIVGNLVQLGGNLSPIPLFPSIVPRNLVPPGVPTNPVPQFPPHGQFHPLQYGVRCQINPATLHPGNWRVR